MTLFKTLHLVIFFFSSKVNIITKDKLKGAEIKTNIANDKSLWFD